MMHSLLEKKISVGEISYLISGVLICLGIQIIIINNPLHPIIFFWVKNLINH